MSDSAYDERLKTTGRNDRCPCGSGKKYKKCHMAEDEGSRTATLKALEEEAKAKASQATEGDVQKKGMDQNIQPTKRQQKQPGPKGSTSEGRAKTLPHRSTG